MQEERVRNATRACKEGTWIKDEHHFIFLQKSRIRICDIDGEVKNYYHHRPWYKVYQNDWRFKKL